MIKIFKCPICGCEEHYEFPFIRTVLHEDNNLRSFIKHRIELGAYSDASISVNEFESNISAYLCKECDHVDFFAEGMLNDIQKDKERLKGLIDKQETLISPLMKQEKPLQAKIAKLDEQIADAAKLLKDENITIKKHKELREESTKMAVEKHKLEDELRSIQRKIEPHRAEIMDLKNQLSKVEQEKPSK